MLIASRYSRLLASNNVCSVQGMCTSRMDGTLDEINETGEGNHLERGFGFRSDGWRAIMYERPMGPRHYKFVPPEEWAAEHGAKAGKAIYPKEVKAILGLVDAPSVPSDSRGTKRPRRKRKGNKPTRVQRLTGQEIEQLQGHPQEQHEQSRMS
ncbi:hypothetical protein WJX75_000199 [Coccomyxa subellipsoidea]|uniref:Uncharacterized protein n=1 Tax=Coccomyxa subellipsoidea TaxID=248742 RepID=A0ABR2YLD4_9CHLO